MSSKENHKVIMDIFNHKTRNKKMPINVGGDIEVKKFYVYALGFLFKKEFMVFYIGRTGCLNTRLANHERSEAGSVAMCIGFDLKCDAEEAEDVLINYYSPRENIYIPKRSNNQLANLLTGKKWAKYREYVSGVRRKKYKGFELFNWAEIDYPSTPMEIYEYEIYLKKQYSIDECYVINQYIEAAIKAGRFIDLLIDDDLEQKARKAFRGMINKGIDDKRVTNWIYQWLSETGIKRLNSNLRQAKYRQDNNIKTLKLSQGLISSISAGARANNKSIEKYLAYLVNSERKS